ncbi:DNA (cytosine-5)-methyltransferase 1 [Bradyrhizobium japonicum]|uniref:DNA cytosine methyltransferase n=1 Tax=Bradyrhizobium TaxID=374 RepID=UPI0003FD9B75|nr:MULTISPECIES: DNA cytosine methyltransferase [Bradyrhizobium]MBR1000519.1 DNA cytosine methyltransferase [Bradyrhizobium liaoningense]MCP1863705.1 DNA (cytosine-5)-methyltransferase 1 [Bradyrhizobium japonicum]WLB98560.1 DNA cytosine methyltransferase [Bradyrhizobium japonicum USDA 123]
MKAIDLFSGGGCGSAGARHAGMTMVAAADAWDIAAKTYQDNFKEAEVVTARLTDRSGPEMFNRIGRIDMLIASPECTHHSIARGNKPVDEESRRSGWYVMNFIRKLDPRWIVLENVTPMRHWPGFDDLIAELKKTYHLRIEALDAADFGTPQNRRRLFIMGDKLGAPALAKPILRTERDAASILDRAGTYQAEPVYNGKRADSTIKRVERGIAELGRKKDFLIVYYGSDRAGGWQRLDRPLRTLTTLDRFGLVQWIDGEPTLRMLQVPELKRAMGLTHLKDHRGEGVRFELDHGTRRDKIKVLGNGVCAPVMRAVVGSLIGGGSSDLLDDDLRPPARQKSASRRPGGKKSVRH